MSKVKILVPTKRVPDTDQKIVLQGQGIDPEMPYVVNPFDAIALEEAVRIGENSAEPVEVVAIGIGGPQYEKELRTALAMGADRAVLVLCAEAIDPWNVARILKEMVSRETPDLVLMGKQAVDDDSNQTGQFLAAQLNWPQATFASRVEFVDGEEGGGVRVDRETDAGIETVRMSLPAVITTDLRLNEPRYASLPSIMKARKKPIEQISVAELSIEIEPRVRILKLESVVSNRRCQRVADLDELLDQLKNQAEVI